MKAANPKQTAAAIASALDLDLTRFEAVSHCSTLSTHGVIMRAPSIRGTFVTWLPAHTSVSSIVQCLAAASIPAPFSSGDTLRLLGKDKTSSMKESNSAIGGGAITAAQMDALRKERHHV